MDTKTLLLVAAVGGLAFFAARASQPAPGGTVAGGLAGLGNALRSEGVGANPDPEEPRSRRDRALAISGAALTAVGTLVGSFIER